MIQKTKKLHNIFLLICLCSILSIHAKDTENNTVTVTGLGFQIQQNIRVIEHDLCVKDKDFEMTATRGMFYPDLQLLKAVSNVILEHEKFTLTCDEVSAYIEKEKVVASGNPKVVEKKREDDAEKNVIQFTSRIIQFERATHVLSGFNNARIVRNIGKDQTVIRSDNMYFYYKKNVAEAVDNVIIDDPKFQAQSDKALYYRDGRERIELIGNAWAMEKNESNPNEVSGKKIVYYFDTSRISVVGSTEANIRYEKKDR